MAGSYKHCVDDDGTLYKPGDLLLDDPSWDTYEAVEQMYRMINVLTSGDPDKPDKRKIFAAWKKATGVRGTTFAEYWNSGGYDE